LALDSAAFFVDLCGDGGIDREAVLWDWRMLRNLTRNT
jgi:hypothetical protein